MKEGYGARGLSRRPASDSIIAGKRGVLRVRKRSALPAAGELSMGRSCGPFRPWIFIAFSLLIALVVCDPAFSQTPRVRNGAPLPNKPELGSAGERLNANTIAIVSGNLNATYLSIAYDLSAVLDDGDEFRVLPVVGKGGGQNIRDVRFLKGVDLGITQSVLLNAFHRSNEIGRIDDK